MALWSALLARPAQTSALSRPSLTLYFLLAGAFLLTLVPHIVQLPSWLTISIVAAIVLRSVMEVYRLPLPSTTFCGILALILLVLVTVQFSGRLWGRDPGTALTAGLLAIKFYELRRPRDVALIIFSCFFVVMSALLYEQYLELFIYCLIMMWILTALLVRVHTGDLIQDNLLRMLRQSGIIFLQALPLALFLFFFFPRYNGILSLVLEEPSIGLSDTVSPGSIAKLSTNDDPAMYVRFLGGPVPLTATMYWRALVLWNYSGGTWTPGDISYSGSNIGLQTPPVSEETLQEISIWPHNQRWLFALDVPNAAPVNTAESSSWAVVRSGDVVQLQSGKLDHRARYTVTSAPPAEEILRPGMAIAAQQLPPPGEIDPRVQQLANVLWDLSGHEEQAYVNNVLHYFRHQGFTYSASPGVQGTRGDWLPVFLFETKTGFCEHFASAFAILMRIEKIPARLVVGYLGGDYNPYGDEYFVSQSNAHAWDEVWVNSPGDQPALNPTGKWMRVDPTALLNTAENGALANNPQDAGDTLSKQVARSQAGFAGSHLPEWLKNSLREFQLRREQIETNWDNLVFSYDPEVQSRLAQALGFGDRAKTELLLICLAAGGVCLLVFKKWVTRKIPLSPLENLYATFCQKMAQRGIPRANWEGPLAYTDRVAEAFPDDKPAIQRFGAIVAEARYGPAPVDPAMPEHLKSLLTLLTAAQAASPARERS